jgi:hypothetical protein
MRLLEEGRWSGWAKAGIASDTHEASIGVGSVDFSVSQQQVEVLTKCG